MLALAKTAEQTKWPKGAVRSPASPQTAERRK
jgi:hypothetical protein